jgi:dynein heavy chain
MESSVERRKIETLVTIHVHQKDVTKDLEKISDPNDFEFLKQARFYWRATAGWHRLLPNYYYAL